VTSTLCRIGSLYSTRSKSFLFSVTTTIHPHGIGCQAEILDIRVFRNSPDQFLNICIR